MMELCYDAYSLALFVVSQEMGSRTAMDFLEKVYIEEQSYLRPDYIGNKKLLFTETLYWMEYLIDKEKLDAEFPAVRKDFKASGREFVEEAVMSEHADVDTSFMFLRLRIKYKILRKYIADGEPIRYDNIDDPMSEYIGDIRQLISLISSVYSTSELSNIREMAKDAYIIKMAGEDEDEDVILAKPEYICLKTSDEDIDLSVYWAPFQICENDKIGGFGVCLIDSGFYEEHDIPYQELVKLGVMSKLFIPGERSGDGVGDGYWRAQGEFCPYAEIDGVIENIAYIVENPEEELSRKKSAELLKLVLIYARKLKGYVRYRRNNPYEKEEEASVLCDLRDDAWLYGTDGKLHRIKDMSKYELDRNIYGEIFPNKEAYTILGFAEKMLDVRADTFDMVESLDEKDQMILLRRLARKFGKSIAVSPSIDHLIEKGDYVAYRNPDGSIYEIEINPDQFPLHKVFLGKRIGDEVEFIGRACIVMKVSC